MPKYFFHLDECGDGVLDAEGSDLPDLTVAREKAIVMARSIMKAEVDEGRLCMKCAIKIAGEDGAVLMTLQFSEAVALTGV